jgi:hypothetical protein
METKFSITHKEIEEIIPDQGSQPGNLSNKLSENEMNGLLEKMIDEFEHKQVEKVFIYFIFSFIILFYFFNLN